MTIAIRGTPTQTTSNGVCAKPTGVVSGDVLVALLGNYNAAAVTSWTSTGWTVLTTQAERGGPGGSDLNCAVMYKVAGGSEPSSYTFSQTGSFGNVNVIIVAYSGVDNSTPFDSSFTSNNSAGNNATVTGTSITVTNTNDLLLWMWFGDDSSLTAAPSGSIGSLTQRVDGTTTGPVNLDFGVYGWYDGALSASGSTGNYSVTSTFADTWIVFMAALNAASTAGGINVGGVTYVTA
jgi:hypothetical protein